MFFILKYTSIGSKKDYTKSSFVLHMDIFMEVDFVKVSIHIERVKDTLSRDPFIM